MAGAMHQMILDEASYAAAAELARLQGGSIEACVAQAVRSALSTEREAARQPPASNDPGRQERDRKARAWLARWHERLGNPPPLSDHSWLYDDETGLPV